MPLGGNGGCPGTHEGIEDESWSIPGCTRTLRDEVTEDCQASETAGSFSFPRNAAACADALGTRAEEWPSDERLGEHGVMSATVVAGSERPDIAGVLAEKMSNAAVGFGAIEPDVRSGERSGPLRAGSVDDAPRGGDARLLQRRPMRHTDGIEVEEVALRARREVDDLLGA